MVMGFDIAWAGVLGLRIRGFLLYVDCGDDGFLVFDTRVPP
jgi:hypothetical protein